eukprot:TRINITY_DN22442_c0_g1_i1.p1 TRINITY_DN22442_c0_g1~~TRINITY_DN22442_c0_g1_i1.p1  ORF type:complete len:560 (+),score=113.88 TRINITY_DN22442_c0_g1_i1:254-1681(+)
MGSERFNHMLDGYGKTVSVSFHKGKAIYGTKFLRSAFYNQSVKNNRIAQSMSVGGVTPDPHWGATAVLGANDNNYIKMRKVGDQAMLLSDTTIASVVDTSFVNLSYDVHPMMSMETPGPVWKNELSPIGDMCMLGTMAHAAEHRETGTITGIMGCFGLHTNYIILFDLEAQAPTTQKMVAKISLGLEQPPYMHAMGSTDDSLILIANPLTMNLMNVMQGKPLGRGGLQTSKSPTRFYVVNRKTGAVRTLVAAESFITGHLINSWEENGDIYLDLTWYEGGNATTLGWFNRWFLDYMQDEQTRDSWPHSKIMRYRLRADGSVESKLLFEEEQGNNDFETPRINEEYTGKSYCVAYLTQFHSYDYRQNMTSIAPGPFAAIGTAKRNVCTGERSGWYEPDHYPSEVQFVPNPLAKDEDDGVLLGLVLDGTTNSSYFHILDAKTMKQIAKAPVPVRSPFLVHASWFPDFMKPPGQEIVV